jgi:hypothetical protein
LLHKKQLPFHAENAEQPREKIEGCWNAKDPERVPRVLSAEIDG